MNLFMRGFTLLLLSSIFLCAPAFATDQADLRNEIGKMLTLSKTDQLTEPVINKLENMLQAQTLQLDISEAQKPLVDKYNQEILFLVKKEMAWDNMRDELISSYAKIFTIDEVKAINEFYSSEIGQKMVEKMPQLMQESQLITQRKLQIILPQIQKLSEEMMKALAEGNHQ